MAVYKKISDFGNVTPVSSDLYLIEKADGTYSYVTGTQLLAFFGGTISESDILTKQVIQITSSTAPTVNVNGYRRTFVDITALTGNINLSTNLTGTPENGDVLWFQIKDNGTARTITCGSLFEAKGEDLPTTTVMSKRINIGATWDSTRSKWGVIAVAQEL